MKMVRSNLKFKSSILTALVLTVSFGFLSRVEAKSKKAPGDSGVEEQLKFKEGDENGNEIKALKTEMLVINSESKALAQLQKLDKRYKGTRMESEILFRLAEIYMRRARSERFFEVHKTSDQVLSFAPSMVKAANEAKEVRKASAIYKRIEEEFPRFRSMDLVIFNNAYAHQQIGDNVAAETLLKKLIKEHDGSVLVPDAYLAVGEIDYARRDFKAALENFKSVRRFPNARVYPYGLYKAAWSYYNLQDATAGLAQLEDVVKFGRDVASKGDSTEKGRESKLDLRKEALGDMALFYGDVKPATEAVAYFGDQAQGLDPVPFIMRLVGLYDRHSRYGDVESVLKNVLVKFPQSESVAQVHEELIWNYERMKKRSGSVAQLESFDTWCTAQTKASTECRAKIVEVSKKLATKWHALWKKQGGPDDLAESAEKSYALYLRSVKTPDKDSAGVHYSYAELLFARSRFRDASQQYAMIDAYRAKVKDVDAKVAHDAAYGAIVSLERANGDKWNAEDEKQFGELAQVYDKHFHDGQYALDLRFKRAFIAYEKERYDEAAQQFKKIGWMDLKAGVAVPEKVVKAQDLYLDILNVKKDFKGLREAAASLLAKNGGEQRTTHVEKIYREAYFAEIQQLEEKGDLVAAIDSYKKFAMENAKSDLAPKAWWNASQLQFRLGDASGGANTCYQMHKLFPNSPNGRECLTQAAQTFENQARLDLAARVLLNLADVEVARQDHWREVSADFFALSGEKSRAIMMYLKLADVKKGKERWAILEKAAQLSTDTGDVKTLAQIQAKFSADGVEPQASRLVVEKSEKLFRDGDFTEAFNLAKRIISRDSLPKDLLARARFVQAQVLEDEYRKQSVKAKVERIGMVLAIKTEKLEKAQKAYQSVIHYNDGETSVLALRRLANCYLDYAHTVRDISLPGDVPVADAKAFHAEVEQLSIPMEEKGIEAMNQALETAKKAQLRDGQIADINVELNRLNLKKSDAPALKVVLPAAYVPEFHARAPAKEGQL